MEVAGLHFAIGHLDATVQRGAEPEHDGALHLGFDDMRVDGKTTVDCTHNLVDLDAAVAVETDFGNLCDAATE